ncbi:MAG: ATP-binding protein [Anaerolineae bacterium]|nr:ATP-binding protein [Anaerolineae bacterium]
MLLLPDYRVRQRDYLLEISRALTQELDLDKLLGRILSLSIDMLSGQAGIIVLRSPLEGWQIRVTQGLPAAFIKIIQPLLANVPYNTESPETAELPEINRLLTEVILEASMGQLTGVGLPLVARKQVSGSIFIFRGYPNAFSNNDRALLSSFADQAAIAVQNALLYTQTNQQKQRLNAILDSAADGMLILTPGHIIERCNPAFAHLVGKNMDEIQGQNSDDILKWAATPQGMTLDEAEAGGWPLTTRSHLYIEGDLLKNNDPHPLPVGVTYAPLISVDGKLMNIIASIRDITHFRQADELKSTFISIISHELKTPVALIKGYVSTLRREDANWDPTIVQDSLAIIEEEADRLTGMIENLLDASRLQAGGLNIKRTDMYLPDLCKRLADRFQTQTEQHHISTDFPDDFPVLLADETRISQVISNLISNALKYAPKGEIIIRGQVRPNHITISVSDEGPGISASDIPHVFDRFYRAPDMARQTKGAGLGLYLSRAIIEAHGGRMWVDTEPVKGTRICFTLPRN